VSTDWKAELEKFKTQPLEKVKTQKKTPSKKTELKELMRLLKTQLSPVIEVFTEEGETRTEQPHIHEYDNGCTLVLPVFEEGIKPIIFRLQFEFKLAEEGISLKVIRDTEENMLAPEKSIEAPITVEKIRNEIRDFLRERQMIILEAKREKTS
jgi:hypothetical protein